MTCVTALGSDSLVHFSQSLAGLHLPSSVGTNILALQPVSLFPAQGRVWGSHCKPWGHILCGSLAAPLSPFSVGSF